MKTTKNIQGLEPLTKDELQTTNGGGLIVFAFLIGVYIGYKETH